LGRAAGVCGHPIQPSSFKAKGNFLSTRIPNAQGRPCTTVCCSMAQRVNANEVGNKTVHAVTSLRKPIRRWQFQQRVQ